MTTDAVDGMAGPEPATTGRPLETLPLTSLLRLSLFWLGLTAIDALITNAMQSRLKFDGLVPPEQIGTSLALLATLVFGVVYFVLGALTLRSVIEPPRRQALSGYPSPA